MELHNVNNGGGQSNNNQSGVGQSVPPSGGKKKIIIQLFYILMIVFVIALFWIYATKDIGLSNLDFVKNTKNFFTKKSGDTSLPMKGKEGGDKKVAKAENCDKTDRKEKEKVRVAILVGKNVDEFFVTTMMCSGNNIFKLHEGKTEWYGDVAIVDADKMSYNIDTEKVIDLYFSCLDGFVDQFPNGMKGEILYMVAGDSVLGIMPEKGLAFDFETIKPTVRGREVMVKNFSIIYKDNGEVLYSPKDIQIEPVNNFQAPVYQPPIQPEPVVVNDMPYFEANQSTDYVVDSQEEFDDQGQDEYYDEAQGEFDDGGDEYDDYPEEELDEGQY